MSRVLVAGFALLACVLRAQSPEADANRAAAFSNLGIQLARSGKYNEAIGNYSKALALLPGNPAIETNLGLAYYKSGRIQEAAAVFAEARKAAPENEQIALLLADCDLRMGRNDAVVDLLSPLEQQHPDDLAIAYLLGTALIRNHQVEAGQQRVDRILGKGDSAEARYLLGDQMFEAGDYPSAVKQLTSAIAMNPALSGLQSLYGQALLNTGDPDGAAAAFRKELAADSNDFAANLRLGQILLERKQLKEAQPYLERALRVRNDSAETLRSLSRLYSLEGHREEATHYAQQAERLAPVGVRAADPGPKLGTLAPDFSAIRTKSSQPETLKQLRGDGPLVLVFGSYTCPNFRAAAASLNGLYAKYKRKLPFYLVYIREAHDSSEWRSTRNEREGIILAPARNMSDRMEHASLCVRKLRIEFPALADTMSGAAERAYSAWPSRAFVIDAQGRVAYASGLSELDYKQDQLEEAIKSVCRRP